MNAPTDLYGNISEIRDALDTLLKRGKPASVVDLQQLVATIEGKSRPVIHLNTEKVATELVPKLLPLLPTAATLNQAGQDAAKRIEAAIQAGTLASVQQVQYVMQQLTTTVQKSAQQTTAAAAEQRAAAAAFPRSIPVSFTSSWRWPVGLFSLGVVLTLLLSWVAGVFGGVEQAKYDQLLRMTTTIQNERNQYRDQIQYFRQDMSKGKNARVTTQLAKQYFPPIGTDTEVAK